MEFFIFSRMSPLFLSVRPPIVHRRLPPPFFSPDNRTNTND